MEIAALVIGIVALVIAVGFGIWQMFFNRKIEKELLGSGETLLEARWVWSDDTGRVRCQTQARQVPVSDVVVGFGREQKTIGALQPEETKTVDFINAPKGEYWTVTFLDPKGKHHKESYQIWGNTVNLFG